MCAFVYWGKRLAAREIDFSFFAVPHDMRKFPTRDGTRAPCDLALEKTLMVFSIHPHNPLHCKSPQITFRNGNVSSLVSIGENRSREIISLSTHTECQT